MPLFGPPPRPKGITKEELHFIRAELMSAPFGHANEKLNQRQIDEIMEDLNMNMDPDTPMDLKYGWNQVSAVEVAHIEAEAENGKGMKYTKAQVDHIKRVLQKYLDINKHKSLF